MRTGVVVLNFGEPPEPDEASVADYLERIFRSNASLEDHDSEEAMRARSRELAERRTPGLLAEYRQVGGSPLNEQARDQAAALESELRSRGLEARTYTAMQFTEPFAREAVEQARSDGVERLVGLPIYPLCGESTTVAALRELAGAVREAGWDVPRHEVAGWHRHPVYRRLRAEAIAAEVDRAGLDLEDPGTVLLFSAHGTPLRYLERGNRYVLYVRDHCDAVAADLGVDDYALGYQNHGNRERVAWTRPDVEEVVEALDADRVVVDACSFMHEQSETLLELDHDLRGAAEDRGLRFHRVPVPHDDERFRGVLADLVEAVLPDRPDRELAPVGCRCRDGPAAACLNGTI